MKYDLKNILIFRMAGMKTLIQLMDNCPVVSTAQTCLIRAKVVKLELRSPPKVPMEKMLTFLTSHFETVQRQFWLTDFPMRRSSVRQWRAVPFTCATFQ